MQFYSFMVNWNLFIDFFYFFAQNQPANEINTVKLGVGEPFDNIILVLLNTV